MGFRGDERAVTVQIGAVLLFGIIIISMSMYQATVVPNQNEQVEFLHNQEVHDQFKSLRGAVIESSSEPTARPSTVSLGTRYPSRTLFVNPGPVSGTLQTRDLGTLAVSNIETTEAETSDYVDGGLSYPTKSLEYRPDYNVMQSTPTTVYENTIAYNRFETGYNGTLTGQSLINGRTISLVLLGGNYSENGVGSATVDAQAVSPATRTVSVTNTSERVNITVPTKLSAAEWRDVLEDDGELNDPESDDDYVYSVTDGPGDTVFIEMKTGVTYDLRVGAVEVGSDDEEPSAHYITVVETSSSSATFEVRDRYNNPVSGVTVNTTALPSTTLSAQGQTGTGLTNLRTDTDGRVTVSLDTPTSGTYTLQASIDRNPANSFDASRRQDADVDVVAGGSGTGTTGPYNVVWDGPAMDSTGGSAVSYYSSNDTLVVNSSSVSQFDGNVDVTDRETGMSVANVVVDFATNNSSVLTGGLGTGTTGGSGTATTTVSVADGVATAYATAGGSYDTISVKVGSGSGDGGGGDGGSGGGDEPFLDTDDDGVQDPGEESVPISELDGGDYNANTPLVIPEGVDIDAGDSSVTYNVPSVNISGSVLTSKQITIRANTGDIVLDGANLTAGGGTGGGNNEVVLISSGSVSATDAILEGTRRVSITANGGGIDLRRSTVRSYGGSQGDIELTANDGDIDLRDAIIDAARSISYTANNGNVIEGNTTYPHQPSPV
ncbi:hypothetical protein DEQ92_10840 [Haloferax sp. Atlit-6N]|uniref:Ig-like domain-containing protein n=1 Tax=Haloferax sp. Atlit-6N TaxID=2077205 RepID=UPI000E2826DA|nr:Ig-like domain-containing protein [Haloferax sp. Atlit-6N]REA03603.1 hypothetical protein DEQ92_10840 [Haloferax sp. Atlit-6N]